MRVRPGLRSGILLLLLYIVLDRPSVCHVRNTVRVMEGGGRVHMYTLPGRMVENENTPNRPRVPDPFLFSNPVDCENHRRQSAGGYGLRNRYPLQGAGLREGEGSNVY